MNSLASLCEYAALYDIKKTMNETIARNKNKKPPPKKSHLTLENNQIKVFNVQEGRIKIFARHKLAKRYDEFQTDISKNTTMYVKFGSTWTMRMFVPMVAQFEK